MSTPYSALDSLSTRQRSQVDPHAEEYRAEDTTVSPSPSGGFMQRLPSKSRLLPLASSVADRSDPEQKKKLDNLFAMRRRFLETDTKSLLQSICDHVELRLGRSKWSFNKEIAYSATALSVRDHLIELWNDTNAYFHEKKPKRLYYLSIEFLIGRLLRSNMLSLAIESDYTKALSQIGLHMEEIAEEELDMGLGNGGLGRLAACFLDSMATLRLPAWGYGLRYQYGMFKQRISKEGDQVELPDYWLENGCPWEIKRLDVRYTIRFYGYVREEKHTRSEIRMKKGKVLRRRGKGKGELLPYTEGQSFNENEWQLLEMEMPEEVEVETAPTEYFWENTEDIYACAYDVPIAGYHTLNVINLRLWQSMPKTEFDFNSFNRGSYDDAMRAKQAAETITQVLYPNDSFDAGKELRLKQQYFFVSASLQDIMRRFRNTGMPIQDLHKQCVMQCNDTHPVLAIPELMRILLDEEHLTFDEAWELTQKCFAYTNHTVLPEALEKWSVDLLGRVVPRHLQIIYQINWLFMESVRDRFPDDLADLSIIEEHPVKAIRMANLAIVTSIKVNGVAALHSQLLKTTIFRKFFKVFPKKFLNVTNGVTQRRWLLECNTPLSQLFTSKVGPKWATAYKILRQIEPHVNDAFISQFWDTRRIAKERLAALIKKETGITLNNVDEMLFDVQVKRIHEYKRQSLNIVRAIAEYLNLRTLTPAQIAKKCKKMIFFAGKAAPGYYMAKKTIKLINCVANVVNNDETIGDALKIVFLPNYNVSSAQVIIPAADIHEQISTAGYEASGTSCMKFCMNGGIIIGTWDGANIEILEEIGAEQTYMFGLKTEEVEEGRRQRHAPNFKMDSRLEEALLAIEGGLFGPKDEFMAFVDSIRHSDHYIVANDFPLFMAAHEQVEKDWLEKNSQGVREKWGRRAILSSIRMDKFSSDRSIIDYSEKIWKIKPCMVPAPIDAQ
ncbi:putative Glycogen phosphorylase 1 [Blattamonas nauphoetae]|uniref:Alpha-1,4 glucan phosphorylase n=1 Tax=Blattamonas nauphoetae TaxID=2049346 RepID=A0ABQ9XXP5_9EUKA|nr:putative Glycogen phosphorylase 1 [Blattamonas nauphoetae]